MELKYFKIIIFIYKIIIVIFKKLCLEVVRVAEFESELQYSKFKMTNSIWWSD